MIYVREDLKLLFTESCVEDFLQIDGEIYKQVVASRRTIRFERDGKAFFLKAHWGVGWAEIIKNLISLRWPVIGARNEWLAIQALQRLGVDTMSIAAYGEQGCNPAAIRSFLITDALLGTEDLEHWLPELMEQPQTAEIVRLKRAVVQRLAQIARTLHTHGINHRDFYLCHLRIALPDKDALPSPSTLRIYLMDLHRVQQRRRTPQRWIVKDIGSLLYSSLFACRRPPFNLRDYLRFVETYSDKPWRLSLYKQREFWRAVVRRARWIYHRAAHHEQQFPKYLEDYL